MDKIFLGIAALLFGVGTLFASRRAEGSTLTDDNELGPIKVPDLYDYRDRSDMPRGLRNNNPGNIEDTGIPWQGYAGNDGRYIRFENSIYGVRAMMIDIHTGFVRDNENTVRKIIREWAPASENDTASYIQAVCKSMNVAPDQTLSFRAHIIPLARAITKHENGYDPFPYSFYQDALRLTGK